MIREAVRKMENNINNNIINNNCGISFWVVFNWPEYGISSFAEHIYRKFLTAEFDLISCKAIRSRGKLTILYLFIYCKQRNFGSIFYNHIFATPSSNFYFSKIFRKFEQIATRCHCPVTIRKDHKSAEVITHDSRTRI